MDLSLLKRRTELEWVIEPRGKMRVPGLLFASEPLVRAMDHKVLEQVTNVATLPGIRAASMAMPDAHWGYGFAVGGVAAFDPDEGVVSAGGVGFDISCGVRCLRTRLTRADVEPRKKDLADALFRAIPAGVGSRGSIRLSGDEMDRMLRGGARWAVEKGWGEKGDLERIEEGGRDEGRAAGGRLRPGPGPHARRGGDARLRQPLPRGAGGGGSARRGGGRGVRAARGRCGHLHPLRLAGLRPPDRHRGTARDARRGPEARDRPARPRARLRPDPLEGGRALPRRDARRHQRGPRQPPGPHPPHARGDRAPSSRSRTSPSSTTSRTTPARSRRTRWTGSPARSTSTARARRGRGGPGTRGCPTACVPWASRCSSAARWARRAGCWPAPRAACARASGRPATGPAAA